MNNLYFLHDIAWTILILLNLLLGLSVLDIGQKIDSWDQWCEEHGGYEYKMQITYPGRLDFFLARSKSGELVLFVFNPNNMPHGLGVRLLEKL